MHTVGTQANRRAWFATNDGEGGFATMVATGTGGGSWTAQTAFSGLSMQLQGEVGCGANWMGAVTPASGTLQAGGDQPLTVSLLGNGLSAGNYSGFLCVASNDPVGPVRATRVALTVTP